MHGKPWRGRDGTGRDGGFKNGTDKTNRGLKPRPAGRLYLPGEDNVPPHVIPTGDTRSSIDGWTTGLADRANNGEVACHRTDINVPLEPERPNEPGEAGRDRTRRVNVAGATATTGY